MVTSMRSHAKVSKFLWIEALKTIIYVVNLVLTKAVLRKPFYLFKVWKPNL